MGGLWVTDAAEYQTAYGMHYASNWDGEFWNETTQPDPDLEPDGDDEDREETR